MIERWLEIDEFPRYFVSNLGRVKNRMTDRVLVPGTNRDGYLHVKLWNNDGETVLRIHRLVAVTFFDFDIRGFDINHLDGNKRNNILWNLEICTRSENMKHAYSTGLVHMPKETKVLCVETGEIFRTMRDAARAIGVYDHKAIMNVIDNPNRASRGYHFETIERRPIC